MVNLSASFKLTDSLIRHHSLADDAQRTSAAFDECWAQSANNNVDKLLKWTEKMHVDCATLNNKNGTTFTYIMNVFISLRRPMQTNYENTDGFPYLYFMLFTFEFLWNKMHKRTIYTQFQEGQAAITAIDNNIWFF